MESSNAGHARRRSTESQESGQSDASSNAGHTRRRSIERQESRQCDASADITQCANPSNTPISPTVVVPVDSVGTPDNGQHTTMYKGWLTIESFMNNKNKLKSPIRKIQLLIFSIGIFYVLPTIQLLYTYHQVSYATCYSQFNVNASYLVNPWLS